MCVTWKKTRHRYKNKKKTKQNKTKQNKYFFSWIGLEIAAAKNVHFARYSLILTNNCHFFVFSYWKMESYESQNGKKCSASVIIHVFSMKCQIIDVQKQ